MAKKTFKPSKVQASSDSSFDNYLKNKVVSDVIDCLFDGNKASESSQLFVVYLCSKFSAKELSDMADKMFDDGNFDSVDFDEYVKQAKQEYESDK